jgi:histone H3/H4
MVSHGYIIPRCCLSGFFKSGAGRVSSNATTTLATLMEEYGTFPAKELKKISDPAGRKTVRISVKKIAAEMFK